MSGRGWRQVLIWQKGSDFNVASFGERKNEHFFSLPCCENGEEYVWCIERAEEAKASSFVPRSCLLHGEDGKRGGASCLPLGTFHGLSHSDPSVKWLSVWPGRVKFEMLLPDLGWRSDSPTCHRPTCPKSFASRRTKRIFKIRAWVGYLGNSSSVFS